MPRKATPTNLKGLYTRITAAQQEAEEAKRSAKLAKISYKAAKAAYREAKQVAKKLRKAVRALKEEFARRAAKGAGSAVKDSPRPRRKRPATKQATFFADLAPAPDKLPPGSPEARIAPGSP